jgi:hypothetical protein
LALGFAVLMLINATFFHVAPLLWTRGRYSPVFAAFVLFYLLVGMNVLEEVVRRWCSGRNRYTGVDGPTAQSAAV